MPLLPEDHLRRLRERLAQQHDPVTAAERTLERHFEAGPYAPMTREVEKAIQTLTQAGKLNAPLADARVPASRDGGQKSAVLPIDEAVSTARSAPTPTVDARPPGPKRRARVEPSPQPGTCW
jgi:hypothetical protein